ncbi:hypothetical protein FIE12Z_1477 [Fusarium flagelliforme]|uniref:Uncharacterized protein n=1 Tax=Fusarium flagelliforme TaxID=2675880 RepID=A0A395N2M9_9HYPO|nr:hypothetical protein FIE12Z_1477 [Fusarium flagelliforme]
MESSKSFPTDLVKSITYGWLQDVELQAPYYLLQTPPFDRSKRPVTDIPTLLCDPRYAKIKTSLWSSLSEEMKRAIRKEMEDIFFEITAQSIRNQYWYISWQYIDSATWVDRNLDFSPEAILDFFNKEFMVYFEEKPSSHTSYGKFGRYLYRAWLEIYNGRPSFQRGGFLAKPMKFGKNRVQGLDDLSEYHRRLSARLATEMDSRLQFKMCQFAPEEVAHCRPLLSPKIQTFRQHGYLIRPLFRALYMVIDNQTIVSDDMSRLVRCKNEDYFDWRQRRWVHEISQYSVLLVRTGDEETLSELISFLPLFDAGLAVDVNRSDYQDDIEPTVVRVRLDTAIQFIWDLLEKERKASKEVRQVQKRLVREQNEFCQLWVYRLISKVKEFGLDWEEASWIATRRAMAKINDEAFDDDQVEPEWKMVDRWRM